MSYFKIKKYVDMDARSVRHRMFSSWVDEFLKEREHASVMDWGCGPGVGIEMVRESHPGWDFHMADIADKRDREQDKPFYTLDTDNPSLALADNSLDVILCSEVLEHVHNLTSTIREIHRLLKPGGYLIGSVPNFRNLASRLSFLRGALYRIGGRFEEGGHINFITPPFLQYYLSPLFTSERQNGDVDWLSWVDLVPPVPLRYHLAAYGRLDFKGLHRENETYNWLSYDYLFVFRKKISGQS